MPTLHRRAFQGKLLNSVLGFGLIEFLWSRDLFADEVKPDLNKWFKELYDIGRQLHGAKLKDTEFQTKMEDLYRRVDLETLIKYVELDKIAARTKLPDNGAFSAAFNLKIEGVPGNLGFGKQIFCLKKGRAVVPHGHENMCTGFIVLRGNFNGKHFDRLETGKDHYIIKPTIDRDFKPGDLSTVSDHKDNIHWFTAQSETGFIFNIHFNGYDKSIEAPSGRLYLDPEGEKLEGGLIKAKKMSSGECHKKFG